MGIVYFIVVNVKQFVLYLSTLMHHGGTVMKGRIISVNISDKKGEKNITLNNAGFMHRQVSLLVNESIQKMREKGLDVHPGDFAENIQQRVLIL